MLRRARSTNLALWIMAPKDIMSGREQTGSCTSSTTSMNQAGLVVAEQTWGGGVERAAGVASLWSIRVKALSRGGVERRGTPRTRLRAGG